jgi:hypothetical protein
MQENEWVAVGQEPEQSLAGPAQRAGVGTQRPVATDRPTIYITPPPKKKTRKINKELKGSRGAIKGNDFLSLTGIGVN